MGSIAAHELPIHLIKIVRLEHNRRDDALTSRSLHNNRYRAKEDIELRLNCRTLAFLVDDELSAISAVNERAIGDVEGVGDSGGFVEQEVVSNSKSRIIRALSNALSVFN
jgi:hypothetical protein